MLRTTPEHDFGELGKGVDVVRWHRHSVLAPAVKHLRGAGLGSGRVVEIAAIMMFAMLQLLGPETASLSRADQNNAAAERNPRLSFSIYVLSRGTGVPEVGLEALQQVRELFETFAEEGRTVRTKETRIGLEGERRLCAEFDKEEAADEAWRRAQEIVAGVDLVNLKAEPCSG